MSGTFERKHNLTRKMELTDKQKEAFTHKIASMMEDEIDRLIYEYPKCDFEHIWNNAISKATEVVESYKKDEYIGLNEEKLDEFVIGEQDVQ